MTEKIQSPPTQFTASFPVIWLGKQEDELLAIEIKNEHGELGWLYSDTKLVAFERNVMLYGIKLPVLKELAELALKDKQFIKPEFDAAHGRLKRVDKRITGYISFEVLRGLIQPL